MSAAARAQRAGFTLIEVLAVVFMTALLLGVALDFYIDLSNQSVRASEYTREVRRASSILDRVASDFEHALLVRKPEETDPLDHPWVFVAEPRYAETGADRVKFVMRQLPRHSDGAAANLAMVAYQLRPSEEGEGFELRRWTSPGLPEALDRDFPLDGDPDSLLMADGIERFALRFLDENGEWRTSWDSSQLVESSELPRAVEIEIALVESDRVASRQLAFGESGATRYARQVSLPVRPLDMQVLLDPETYESGAGGEETTEDQRTLAECVDFSKLGAGGGAVDPSQLAGLSSTDLSTLAALKDKGGSTSFNAFRSLLGNHPAVRPECR